MLGPWPIRRPAHGGQIRATEIIAAYRAAGHTVRFVGLSDPDVTSADEYSSEDNPITRAIHDEVDRQPLALGGLRFWIALARESGSFANYERAVSSFGPDLVQFEEPFLWPVVRRLKAEGALGSGTTRVPILHSSYNVEHVWRREQERMQGTASSDAAWVEALEQEIAAQADAVGAVSVADADTFRALGARTVAVAPNASSLRPADPAVAAALDQYLGDTPFALFVSSAHPPNALALIGIIDGAPAARLRHGILIVCGEVDRLLRAHPAFPKYQHLFRSTRFLGRISAELLPCLYARAHAVIVPRSTGGGSNLKTAEALLAGRPVVATARGFVGFERFTQAAGVFIEDEPGAFWNRVDALLGEPFSPAVARAGLEELGWSSALRPLVRLAAELGASRSPVADRRATAAA